MINKNLRFLTAISGLLLLMACAGPVTLPPQGSSLEIQQETQRQKEFAYRTLIEDQDRLFNIAFPILSKNAGFCGKRTAPAFGLTMWNLPRVKQEYRQAAVGLYNLHATLAVQHVADHSPASQAGIRSGDLIVAINGRDIEHGWHAAKKAHEALKLTGYGPAGFLLERQGTLLNITVQPVDSCHYPVQFDQGDTTVNAFADGERIVVAKGAVRFAENDTELALMIAHELGHNAMRHIDKKQSNAMIGTIGGLAFDAILAASGVNTGNQIGQIGQELGAGAHSVAFEQEADYVGMYFMERAGYNSHGVADFWRRMAAENPKNVNVRGTHPTSPERFLAIERTRKEIIRKKATGQPLEPNFQPK